MRPMINFIKTKNSQKKLIGVEIGVSLGNNALNILQNLQIKKLYLIDPYLKYDDYNETEFHDTLPVGGRTWKLYNQNQKEQNKNFTHAKNTLKEYKSKIKFIRKKSEDTADSIPNHSLDFAYIDGNHNYKYVEKDIKLFYQKIKPGGVLGGHNYQIVIEGVVEAVDEFVEKNNIELFTKPDDWWVVCP